MQCIYRRQPIINRSCRYVFLFGLVLWNWWTSWTAMMMTQRNPLPGFSATGGGIPPSLLEHTVQVWRYDPGESKGVSTCFQPSITGKGFVTLFGHQPLTWFVITLTQFAFRTTVWLDIPWDLCTVRRPNGSRNWCRTSPRLWMNTSSPVFFRHFTIFPFCTASLFIA